MMSYFSSFFSYHAGTQVHADFELMYPRSDLVGDLVALYPRIQIDKYQSVRVPTILVYARLINKGKWVLVLKKVPFDDSSSDFH